jgi:hypothetical protein
MISGGDSIPGVPPPPPPEANPVRVAQAQIPAPPKVAR